MSSRVTILLFLYGIPLNTAAGKEEIPLYAYVCSGIEEKIMLMYWTLRACKLLHYTNMHL